MSNSACHIELASSNGEYFTNSVLDDIMIHPEYSTQKILLGINSNAQSIVTINNYGLGVGSSNPGYKLDVMGDMAGQGAFTMRDWSGTDAFYVFPKADGTIMSTAYDTQHMYLGGSSNVYLQTYVSGNSNTRVTILNGGNVGIGTSTPSYKLDVAGDINLSGNLYKGGVLYTGSQWSNNNSNVFLLSSNVGIGTSSPAYTLDVSGTVNATTYVGTTITSLSNLAMYGSNTSISASNTSVWSSNNLLKKSGDTMTGTLYAPSIGVSNASATEVLDVTGNVKVSSNMYVMSRLGVGTSNPSVPVHVVGDVRVEGNLNVNGIYNTINTDVQVTDQFTVSNNGTGPALNVYQMGAQSIADFYDDSNLALRIADGGNVGINYTSPSKKLDVVGTARISSETTYLPYDASRGLNVIGTNGIMRLWRPTGDVTYELITGSNGASPGAASNYWWDFFVSYTNGSFNIRDRSTIGGNTSTRLAIDLTGNVGVGTTSPSYKLHVNGTLHSTSNIYIHNAQYTTPSVGTLGGVGDRIILYPGSASVHPYAFGINDNSLWSSVPLGARHQWYHNGSLGMTLSNNQLGIGTATPSYKLDVAGDINFTGSLRSNGNIVSFGGGSSQWISSGANVYVGSGSNVGINTTSPSYPLDINGFSRLGQVYNFAENLPFTFASTNRRYALLATLVANNGFCRFQGIAGGHDVTGSGLQGKCKFDILVDNRNASIRGNVANLFGNNSAGIAIYRDNTSSVFTVYLTGKDWFRHTTQIIVADGSGATISTSLNWGSDTAWTTPSGTTLWFDTTVHIPSSTIGTDFHMSSAATPVYGITQLNTGLVGVGNSNPTYAIDVQGLGRIASNVGQGATNPLLQLQNGTSNIGHFINLPQGNYNGCVASGDYAIIAGLNSVNTGSLTIGNWGDSNAGVHIDKNGCIGVGTNSPTFRLEVNGEAFFRTMPVTGGGAIRIGRSDPNRYHEIYCTNSGTASENKMTFNLHDTSGNTNTTGVMTLNGAGNVGIGTSNPTYRCDVYGKLRLTNNVISQNAGPRLQIADFDGTEDTTMYGIAQITQNSTGVSTWSNQACLAFVRAGNYVAGLGFAKGSNVFGIGGGTGSTAAFTPSWLAVTGGGNVGIGTTAPGYTLDVNGSIRSPNNIFVDYNNGTNFTQLWNDGAIMCKTSQYLRFGTVDTINTATNWSEKMRIHTNGYVGIATSSPSYTLHVAGQIYASGDIVGFSDKRLKSNITIIDDALTKLHKLNGYTFNMHEDTRTHTGLIAQEVQEVLPEAVYEETKDDGTKGYLSLAYGNMVGLLVEAIKEVDKKYIAKTQSLEHQVISLQNEVMELKQLVQKLSL